MKKVWEKDLVEPTIHIQLDSGINWAHEMFGTEGFGGLRKYDNVGVRPTAEDLIRQ